MKKNKLKSIMAVLLICTMLFTLNVNIIPADDMRTSGKCGDNATWTYDKESKVLTIAGTGTVSGFDLNLAESNVEISEIVVKGTIDTIGDSVFFELNFSKILLEEGIKNIKRHAFYGCRGFKEITIPKTVTYMGKELFEDAEDLEKITILGNTKLATGVLGSFNGVKTVEIAGNVGNVAKFNVRQSSIKPTIKLINGNKNYVIKDNIVMSPNGKTLYTYSGDIKGKDITIKKSVEKIMPYAFWRKHINSVKFNKKIKDIGKGAFGYNKLKNIQIPKGIKSIKDMTFLSNNLKKLTIPKNITSIGKSAFGENKIEKLIVPGNVKNIGKKAFYENNIKKLTFKGNKIASIGKHAFLGRYNKFEKVVFHNYFTLDDEAFNKEMDIRYEKTKWIENVRIKISIDNKREKYVVDTTKKVKDNRKFKVIFVQDGFRKCITVDMSPKCKEKHKKANMHQLSLYKKHKVYVKIYKNNKWQKKAVIL